MTTTTSPAHDGTAPAGALTTVFTPPAECIKDRDLYYRTRTCMPLPERWSLYLDAASYYSPGICPSGMVSVATPPPFFGPTIEPGETAIICCPSNYTLSSSSDEHGCRGSIIISTFDEVDVVSTISIDASTSVKTRVTRSYYNTTTSDSVYPIQVRWHESDLAVLETHPLSPGVTPTSVEEKGSGSNKVGGGLSGGAIAGIVIGMVAFVTILCLSAFLLHRRRKSRGLLQRPSVTEAGSPTMTPKPTSRRGSSPMPALDNLPESPEDVPSENENVGIELRRIAIRRARLQELERLDEEEARLRRQMHPNMPPELSSGQLIARPVEAGLREE